MKVRGHWWKMNTNSLVVELSCSPREVTLNRLTGPVFQIRDGSQVNDPIKKAT